MSAITIREAKPKDAVIIGTLHVKTWKSAYRGILPDDYLDSLTAESRIARWTDILSKRERNIRTFVAEIDGGVIGHCSVGPTQDENAGERSGELYSLYIDPDFMCIGAGSKLHKAGLGCMKAAGFRKAILWVLEDNQLARDFYELRGWTCDDIIQTDNRSGVEFVLVRYTTLFAKAKP